MPCLDKSGDSGGGMIEYRILGPVGVSINGRVAEIGGPRLRALLALLLLRANESVPRDSLIHDLWGDRPPAGAQGSLDVYVSRLRKALSAASVDPVVVTRPGAYCLLLADEELDARRFERLVEQGRRALAGSAPGPAAASLRAALELWRGPALGEFGCEPFAQVEAARLEELRLGAIEDRIDADLALGRHAAVTSELEALVAAHPLRERLHAQLMTALYRGGRQADALQAYQSARRTLTGELGLEPGPALRQLEHAILRQDASLGPPAPVPLVTAAAAPSPSPSASGRRTRLGIALAAAGILAGGLLIGFRAAPSAEASLSGGSGLVAVDLATGRLVDATPLPGTPAAVSSGGDSGSDHSLWVANPGTGEVSRIDPGSATETDRIPVGAEPGSIVGGAGAIWVASTVGATVTRIDPVTESVTQTISLPGANPDAIAYGAGELWVADSVDHELFEIQPATGALRRTISLDLQPAAVAVTNGAVWVAGYDTGTVERIDPRSGRTTGRVRVGSGPAALTVGAGSVWVADSLDATVSRVDPATMKTTATVPVGSGPAALAFAAGSVWVADRYAGTVARIDPARCREADTVNVGGYPTSLLSAAGRLWVSVTAGLGRHRGGTLTIVTTNAPGSADPALYDNAENPQFAGLAYDELVTFQQSAGTAGLRLVPDLAVSLPAAADGGLTYAFRIRAGIRYSDGQPLRASDFRRAIERLFRLRSPGSPLYAGLGGAAACAKAPGRCDLSGGIVADDAAGTVTFHLTAADPGFLDKLADSAFSAPVPPGTPDHETGSRTVPGTGPYQITSFSRAQVRFIRNPFFREWSHAAQPAGYPDSIVWRTMPTAQAAVSAVTHGQADWLYGQLPADAYGTLELQDPGQLHSNPQFAVEFLPLNTNVAPFNDVRVRQALNFAIDRNEIVRLYGGPDFAVPTCQPIIPGLPGYQRYCPYTAQPSPDGTWRAPDLARAKQLVAQSGTRGEVVDVWGSPDEGFVPPALPAYIAGVLKQLGYRVRLHLVPFASVTPAMRERFQLSADGDWLADYPDPGSYLPQFFGCDGGDSNGYYCNPALDRAMDQAQLLALTDPAGEKAAWAAIDRVLTDVAAWVPTVTLRDVELTSRRLGNYQYNPVEGFLADQSWVR
jgi:YVTN family beta-propeller protein